MTFIRPFNIVEGWSSYLRRLWPQAEGTDVETSSPSTFVLSRFPSLYRAIHSAALPVIVFWYKPVHYDQPVLYCDHGLLLYLGKQKSVVTSKHSQRGWIFFKEIVSNKSLDDFLFGLSVTSRVLDLCSKALGFASRSIGFHSTVGYLTLGTRQSATRPTRVSTLGQPTRAQTTLDTRRNPLGLGQHSTLGLLALVYPTRAQKLRQQSSKQDSLTVQSCDSI